MVSDEVLIDDQSHYEVSLTAGQAFVAFVLLLLSLAASFAFGLMIGKGQADERLVVRKEPAVINEASSIPKKSGRIVELGVTSDDFKPPVKGEGAASAATPAAEASVLTESAASDSAAAAASVTTSTALDAEPSHAE